MTTLGKILVFLVFVAALALGGMMVYVAKTAPGWKAAYEDMEKRVTVLDRNAKAEAETRRKLEDEKAALQKLLDNMGTDSQGAVARYKAIADEADKTRKTAETQRDKAVNNATEAQAEAKRLQDEVKLQAKVINDREESIGKLQAEMLKYINESQNARNDATTAMRRAQSLMDQNKELLAKIAKIEKEKQPSQVLTARVTDPNYSNPPPVYVKGSIKEVDSVDKKLVTISLGSDNGVKKDMTLEVFRMSPKAEYLGRLLIVDADFRTAIGRLLPQSGSSSQVTLIPGDEVATRLRQ
jgi:hypothetical protein